MKDPEGTSKRALWNFIGALDQILEHMIKKSERLKAMDSTQTIKMILSVFKAQWKTQMWSEFNANNFIEH